MTSVETTLSDLGLALPAVAAPVAAYVPAVVSGRHVFKQQISDLGKITKVVKLVGFVASAPDFTRQPVVVNGAGELLEQVLGDAVWPARSAAVSVARRPGLRRRGRGSP